MDRLASSADDGGATELVTFSSPDATSDALADAICAGYSVPSFDVTVGENLEFDLSAVDPATPSDRAAESEFPPPGCDDGDIRHVTPSRRRELPPDDAPLAYELISLSTVKSDGLLELKSETSFADFDSQRQAKVATPYNRFLERLKHPSCIDIIRAVKGLLAMFPGRMARPDAAAVVHNFIDIYTPRLLSLDAFVDLPESERTASAEFFEKFTMQKLYPQCYSMDPNDRIEDEKLWIKIRCLEWVEPRHLEVSSSVDESVLREAHAQLNNVSRFKSPRDKMVGILNCCRLVVHSLEDLSNRPASADETLPLLIYVTLRANPHELWSSIEFIQHFRHPSRHIAEEAYGFTLLVSAVEYIKAIGSTAHLKMEPEEFQRLFSAAQEPYVARLAKLDEAQESLRGSGTRLLPAGLGDSSVLGRLKKMAQPALMFKTVLFKNLASPEINEALEALAALEAHMLDVPLVFKPDKDFTTDSAALLSDWRALTAMREIALETVVKVRATLSKVVQ